MNINFHNQYNTQKNFQAIKKLPLSTFKTQNADKVFDTYEVISRKYNGFNANFKKDFIQKFPLLRTEIFTKGFLLHSENKTFHLVKNAPRSPLEIKCLKDNKQIFSIKKEAENLIIDICDDFDAKLNNSNSQLTKILKEFFTKINEELNLLSNYTRFFNHIKRKISNKTTKEEIKDLIAIEQKNLLAIQTLPDTHLKTVITELYEQYKDLHELIYQRNGAFTARFKEAYFGKNSPHEKGLTFNQNDYKINILPVKISHKNETGIRTIIFDKDNSVQSAFVLYTNGIVEEVKHKENYKKLMSYNLKSLSSEEIKNAEISSLLSTFSVEIQKYKNFIKQYIEDYHIVRHKKVFKTKIEIATEKEHKILEKEKQAQIKKFEREAKKLKRKEEKLKLKAEKALQKQEERTRRSLLKIKTKPNKEKKIKTIPISKLTYTKDAKSFMDINLTTLVNLIKEIFATPVEKRNPRFSHERLDNDKIFSGRFFIKAKDGTKISVTKIKSAKYVDFEYYSIKTDKNGTTNVINIDPVSKSIIYTTSDSKVLITDACVKHISKEELAEKFPQSDKIAEYIKELFESNDKGKIIKSELKIKKKQVEPNDIINDELQALDNPLYELQNIDTPW